ncbi:MAG: FAD:protein FMN transferase [bacterium]
MKKKKITIITLITFIIVTFVLAFFYFRSDGTDSKKQHTSNSFIMDTFVQMRVYGEDAEDIIDESFARLREVENKMSVNIEDSYVYQINKNAGIAPVTVDEEIFMVIKKAIEFAELSNGKFDPSIGPLIKLWGFGTSNASVPDERELNDVLNKVDYRMIELDEKEKSVFLLEEGMSLDLGGIAKGYAADLVKDIVKKHNIKSAYIDIGGNIYVIGNKVDNTPWNIGIQDPRRNRGNVMASIQLSDKTIVTSGNYERYFIEDGETYHHILDTETGYPADSGIISASIISENSMEADALSTIVFMAKPEESIELIESIDGIEALVIKENLGIIISSGIKDKIKLKDSDFIILD